MHKKHFVRDYHALVEKLRKEHGASYWTKKVMGHAVGGDFDAVGQIHADLLRMHGLRDGMALADIACGSGRTAYALSQNFRLGTYLGIDIVSDLLEFAKSICPPEYQFSLVDGLKVPAKDASFDMCCAFSLFTHLLHEETSIYLRDIHRVLKTGGTLVFSFLEFAMKHHWKVFEATRQKTATGTRSQLNVFIERNAIEAIAGDLGFAILCFQDARGGPFVPLSRPIDHENGTHVEGMSNMGQSVCVLQKTA